MDFFFRVDHASQFCLTFQNMSNSLSRSSAETNLERENNAESVGKGFLAMETKRPFSLPPYDKCENTRLICIAVIIASAIVCFACLVIAVVLFDHPRSFTLFDPPFFTFMRLLRVFPYFGEVLSLIVNLIFTGCLEGLAYIHTTSLRWALYEENRLESNTNLRLFTSARLINPNKWYINTLMAVSLIVCYSSTSLIFLNLPLGNLGSGGNPEYGEEYLDGFDGLLNVVNPVALCGLFLGILSHLVVATWCMLSNLRCIPTWSSNPLTNTLAALHIRRLHRHPDRCIMALDQKMVETKPTQPYSRQKSLRRSIPSADRITILVWSLGLLGIVWGVSVVLLATSIVKKSLDPHNSHGSLMFQFSWSPTYSYLGIEGSTPDNAITVPMSHRANTPLWLQCLLALLFVSAIQGVTTLCLVCVELLVNVTRDEQCWRKAANLSSGSHGAQLNTNSVKFALQSWEYLILFLMKTILHWLLGQSIHPSFGPDTIRFDMVYIRIFATSIIFTTLAIFVTFLVFRKFPGPQPAAWGHLQTLADMIDDWNVDKKGRFWWGDKGVDSNGLRHAGTNSNSERLGDIDPNALYGGHDSGAGPRVNHGF